MADAVDVLTHGAALVPIKFVAPVLALPCTGLEPELGPLSDDRRCSLQLELGCTRIETGGAAGKGKGLHIVERKLSLSFAFKDKGRQYRPSPHS